MLSADAPKNAAVTEDDTQAMMQEIICQNETTWYFIIWYPNDSNTAEKTYDDIPNSCIIKSA
ncbi:hypothetical protein FACS1894122_03200 [Alphaproteobacteria bacterium]|nr:hypothetical protein FACS1894122_03200 [Alphaproteobacteria bacterium]